MIVLCYINPADLIVAVDLLHGHWALVVIPLTLLTAAEGAVQVQVHNSSQSSTVCVLEIQELMSS